MKKGNIIIGILAAIYLVFSFIPLIKSIIGFSRTNTSTVNRTEWVEEPLLIDKT